MTNPIKKDDIVLIIRPNFEGEEWNGTVDLNMICMPSDSLDEESYTEIVGLAQGVVTCFHLLNTDEKFGKTVSDKMDEMIKSGELQFNPQSGLFDSTFDLTNWSPTKRDAQ
jgi:hypothetical protein